jgi:hypothetical protein
MAAPCEAASVWRTEVGDKSLALRRFFQGAALVAGLALAAQISTTLSARHELTQVESIVGMHATMLAGSEGLASGEGLYYDLQRYPFTISPYGPVFYVLSAGLQKAGLPVLLAGRLISLTALFAVLWLSWRLLLLHTGDRAASLAGTLLLASTANVVQWGTAGQVDMLALCFSLAALLMHSHYQATGKAAPLVASALCIALAIFTKQTFVAAGAAISLLVVLHAGRRGLCFVAGLGTAGLGLALLLNGLTAGRFFQNAVVANLNPFSAQKFWQHVRHFLPAAGGLLAITAAGWSRLRTGRFHPFHAYLAAAAAMLALTAPKVGSDLNYQLETTTALCLCAGWSLHRLDFFRLWIGRDRGWVPLLEVPLLFHLVLNAGLSGKNVFERSLLEDLRRHELALLQPYLEGGGRVLSAQIDPLLQSGLRLEVEPLIYTLLVDAGVVDPEPVRKDLAEGRFSLVVLYEDVFEEQPLPKNPEIPSLPQAHLREIRKHYQLVEHIPGPLLNGDYLYQPKEAEGLTTRLTEARKQ